jgi:3-deoxy-manno-octulosonate cytidylyltransferase (CMP-KDO synthetase)
MNATKILAVLPLRLESTRIKQKMLSRIGETTLCEHSVLKAQQAFSEVNDVTVIAAVDSPKVRDILRKSFPKLYILETSPEIQTGTDRVFEAYQIFKTKPENQNLKVQAILNIQGDMPFMGQSGLQMIAQFFRESDAATLKKYPIATLCQKWPNEKSHQQNYRDQGAVKILRNSEGAAIYFSRLPVPYSKKEIPKRGLPIVGELHLGVYGFTPEVLARFCAQSSTELELSEGLEQLRALWLGYSIFGIETEPKLGESYRGIDTPKDLKWAKDFFLSSQKSKNKNQFKSASRKSK